MCFLAVYLLLGKGMATHSSILACEIHGWRNLVGYIVHRVIKELDTNKNNNVSFGEMSV